MASEKIDALRRLKSHLHQGGGDGRIATAEVTQPTTTAEWLLRTRPPGAAAQRRICASSSESSQMPPHFGHSSISIGTAEENLRRNITTSG